MTKMRAVPTTWVRVLVAGLACLVGAVAVGVTWWAPRQRPVPPIEDGAMLVLDREALAQVDLQRVHTELVPAWVVAQGGVKRMHWHRLRSEAGADPNLGALLDRMGVLLDAGPALNSRELVALVGVWNRYLAKAGAPWRLSGDVALGADGGSLRLKSYRVLLDDAVAVVGEERFGVRVQHRVDGTTQVDTWLGHLHGDEGVVVLLDGVVTFTVDRVWPMLDPGLDDTLGGLQQAFGPALRAEVARALVPGDVSALQATAADRLWLVRAMDSVHARHRCGSQFLISRLPWNGLAPRDLATLQLHAADSVDQPCPEVTELEALAFATRSRHVRAQPGLRRALDRLTARVASAVAVHEARHAADVAAARRGESVACGGCPEGLAPVDRLELSAYLASFAHPSSAALSLFQACGLPEDLVRERAGVVQWAAARLVEGGCAAAPPPDLAARAAALERELFGRHDPIRLQGLPDGLPVDGE